MNRNHLTLAIAFLTLLGSAAMARAALITNSDDPVVPYNIVYDENADMYWIQHLGMFSSYTYQGQLAIIADINSNSDYQSSQWGEWRLASLSDMESLWLNPYADLASAFEPSDYDLGEINGRYELAGQTMDEGELVPAHYNVGVYQVAAFKDELPGHLYPNYVAEDWLGAWVTAASPTANVVPEPAALLLVGVGLVGLTSLKKRSRKTKTL